MSFLGIEDELDPTRSSGNNTDFTKYADNASVICLFSAETIFQNGSYSSTTLNSNSSD